MEPRESKYGLAGTKTQGYPESIPVDMTTEIDQRSETKSLCGSE